MRVRYQSKPKVAAFGIILSLGLIFGAQEALESAPVQETEVHNAAGGEPLGVGMVTVPTGFGIWQLTKTC